MIRAVLKDGRIQPLDPIPEEWSDGKPLQVEEAEVTDSADDLEEWIKEVEALAAEVDPKDIERIDAAVTEADAIAKEQMRRELGLP